MDARFVTQGTSPDPIDCVVRRPTVEMRVTRLTNLQRAVVPALLNDDDVNLIAGDPDICDRPTVPDLSKLEDVTDDVEDEDDFWRTPAIEPEVVNPVVGLDAPF
jgi:hypothetical protein